jgi:uncharacterized membrane protein YdcZ (DUF606 family)
MDKRAVEKIDEIVGTFLVSCKFRCVEDQYVCSLQVFMDHMQNMKEALLGRNWWKLIVGFCGSLEKTSFSN